jgi:hypothetical protein
VLPPELPDVPLPGLLNGLPPVVPLPDGLVPVGVPYGTPTVLGVLGAPPESLYGEPVPVDVVPVEGPVPVVPGGVP